MPRILSNGTGGGPWSDPATWQGGVVPAPGNDVTIQAGDTVDLVGMIQIGSDLDDSLRIQDGATLRWRATADARLEVTGGVYMEDGAVLDLDGTASPDYALEIVYDMAGSDRPFGVRDDGWDRARFLIRGYPRGVRWTVLTAPAAAGDTVLQVRDTHGWLPGDTLEVYDWDGTPEVATIQSVAPGQITLAAPLAADHARDMIVINTTANITIRTACLGCRWTAYFWVAPHPDNVFTDWNLHANDHPSWSRIRGLVASEHLLVNTLIANRGSGAGGDGGAMRAHGCVFYCATRNFMDWLDVRDHAQNAISYRNVAPTDYQVYERVYIGFRGGDVSAWRGIALLRDSHVVNLGDGAMESDGAWAFENSVIENVNRLDMRYGAYIQGGRVATQRPVLFRLATALDLRMERVEVDPTLLATDIPARSSVRISRPDEYHEYRDPVLRAHNRGRESYGVSESMELEVRAPGTSHARASVLVEAGQEYLYAFRVKLLAPMANPPRIELWAGGVLVDQAVHSGATGTWERLVVGFTASYDGYAEVRFMYEPDAGGQVVLVSDASNTFHYWDRGYLPPVIPKPAFTPQVIAAAVDDLLSTVHGVGSWEGADAAAVWSYPTRSLTEPVDLASDLRDALLRVRDIEEGRWAIQDDGSGHAVMVLYAPDNTTELARFSLHAPDGSPLPFSALAPDAAADRRRL